MNSDVATGRKMKGREGFIYLPYFMLEYELCKKKVKAAYFILFLKSVGVFVRERVFVFSLRPDVPLLFGVTISTLVSSRSLSPPTVTTDSPGASPSITTILSPSAGPSFNIRTVTVLSSLTT